jgi:hypothetical protein
MATIGNKQMDMNSPETKQLFFAIASGDPRLVQLMGDFRTGKETDPPRGSMNYTTGEARDPDEAAILQWYMDQMRKNIGSQPGYAAGGTRMTAPSTVGEASDLLGNLLGQGD